MASTNSKLSQSERDQRVLELQERLLEIEERLIPTGLHVFGRVSQTGRQTSGDERPESPHVPKPSGFDQSRGAP